MNIQFFSEEIEAPTIKEEIVRKWINAICESFNRQVGEISFIFCNDKKILEINRTYLNHDYYTDVITFDDCDGEQINGDIFISLETVEDNAKRFETEYISELHRVIIHGILHLCGLSDKTPEEQCEMRGAENKALTILNNLSRQ